MGRTSVVYEAILGRTVESVELVEGLPCTLPRMKVAKLIRSQRGVVLFRPSASQLSKIRKRAGTIRITAKQISDVSLFCNVDPRIWRR